MPTVLRILKVGIEDLVSEAAGLGQPAASRPIPTSATCSQRLRLRLLGFSQVGGGADAQHVAKKYTKKVRCVYL